MFYQVAARDNDSALTHRGCPSVRLSICPSVAKMQRDFLKS